MPTGRPGNPTWVHVDGAVMLLAAASPGMAARVRGLDRLDSWSTDGHKLLNVAYDCGIAICRHPSAHRAAMSVQASYLEQGTGARDPMDWIPEFSRRARGLGVYATLRSLGRQGVADLVERTARLSRRFAAALTASGRAVVVNEVVSNQVLVRWLAPDGDHGRLAEIVMAGVRAEGVAFFSGTTYRGERLMRISVSDWATDEDDVDLAVEALLRHAAHATKSPQANISQPGRARTQAQIAGRGSSTRDRSATKTAGLSVSVIQRFLNGKLAEGLSLRNAHLMRQVPGAALIRATRAELISRNVARSAALTVLVSRSSSAVTFPAISSLEVPNPVSNVIDHAARAAGSWYRAWWTWPATVAQNRHAVELLGPTAAVPVFVMDAGYDAIAIGYELHDGRARPDPGARPR